MEISFRFFYVVPKMEKKESEGIKVNGRIFCKKGSEQTDKIHNLKRVLVD